ncbi:annexin A1 [Varanus komodoensis]|uniref:annexin A1 n=1 Tax=Varanus komodoensis TaxID=61221 RepID=UPI001CF7D00F|nr:annexin A1 [Varanus komodoensis]
MAFVQEFLKQAFFIDNDEPQCVKNSKTGSAVHAYPSFNPSADAAALDKAITAKGVDEATIIDILTKRNNNQRQQIKAAYQQLKGKPLEEALKKALKSQLEDVVLALLKTPAQFDAEELRYSMKGLGTDEDLLIEILTSRNNREIREASKAYQESNLLLFLLNIVKCCCKRENKKALFCLLMYLKPGKLKCATSKPAFFAEKLHLAMKGSGTRHRTLNRIMVSRSEVDMNEIKGFYRQLYGKSLCQAILDETKGDYETILVALSGGDN